MVNLRRLIKDITTGKHLITTTPSASPHLPIRQRLDRTSESFNSRKRTPSSLSYKTIPSALRENASHTSSPGKKFLEIAEAIRVKTALPALVNSIRSRTQSKTTNNASPVKSSGLHAAIKAHARELSLLASQSDGDVGVLDASLIQAIYGSVLTWGVDVMVDDACRLIGVKPPATHIILGLQGGFLSFNINPELGDASKWKISSTMTATRTIAIITLTKSVFTLIGDNASDTHRIVAFFEESLDRVVGDGFMYPSFSMLAKYWQDPSSEIQKSVRSLLGVCVRTLPDTLRDNELAYWKLNKHSKNEKLRLRASIILGIVCHLHPTLFHDIKYIAEALESVVRDDPKGTYRVTAIELIGLGFSMWKTYLDGASLILLIINFTGFMTHTEKNSSENITTNTSIHPFVTYNARHAILEIATQEPELFVKVVTQELSHSKNTLDRSTLLHTLGYIMEKNPVLLHAYLPAIVETMIKSLDPHVPVMRDALLPLLTQTIADIVKRYPSIAFNNVTQRLAIGYPDGTCSLYDIRTATRISVVDVCMNVLLLLKAYTNPVTAVSFSADGKLLTTFCLQDCLVKFWQPHGGILGAVFGAFGAVGMPGANANHGTSGIVTLKMFRSFLVGTPSSMCLFVFFFIEEAEASVERILKEVKFVWVSERGAIIHSVDGLEFKFQV